jgi:hypothetical protein
VNIIPTFLRNLEFGYSDYTFIQASRILRVDHQKKYGLLVIFFAFLGSKFISAGGEKAYLLAFQKNSV